MSKTNSGVKYAKSECHIARRRSALNRLELQLKGGIKNTKDGEKSLTDKDQKRITKEIETLKARL